MGSFLSFNTLNIVMKNNSPIFASRNINVAPYTFLMFKSDGIMILFKYFACLFILYITFYL